MKAAVNPILARELKERMRSVRVPIVLTAYLVLLGSIVLMAERYIGSDRQFGPFAEAATGRIVFHYLLFFLLLFVCFMVPAFTSGVISSERERQTLHLVQVTLMSPRAIVNGKLAAAMSYLGLLVVATVPLLSVGFILGGVSPLDVLRGYAMVLLTGLTIGVLSIAISAHLRRSIGATVLAFLLVFALTVGTWIAFGVVTFFQSRDFEPNPRPMWTIALNPFVGTASAIQGKDGGGRGPTPFEGLFSFLNQPRVVAEFAPVPDGFGRDLPGIPQVRRVEPAKVVPMWVWMLFGYVTLSVVGYALAIRGVTTPRAVLRVGGRKRRNVVQEAT